MTQPTRVADLPGRDAGLPRFVITALVGSAALAVWLLVRPSRPAGPMATGVPPPRATVTSATLPGQRSGATLFLQEGCGNCHATTGPSTALGPSLAGAADRAGARIRAEDYRGSADSPAAYLREAIVDHCLDLVPGYDCVAAPDITLRLSAEEIDRLVGFVSRLEAPETP